MENQSQFATFVESPMSPADTFGIRRRRSAGRLPRTERIVSDFPDIVRTRVVREIARRPMAHSMSVASILSIRGLRGYRLFTVPNQRRLGRIRSLRVVHA